MGLTIKGKKVAFYNYYKDYAEYIFYDNNGFKIISFTSDKELTEQEIINEFSDFDKPKKRKEFMW